MDHPWFVQGKTVLDVGSGCGASAIASVLSGASHVLANDICGGKSQKNISNHFGNCLQKSSL